jgi:glycerol-3-phosphate O-acyltransferase/dihydroxyacetone phosphate acyltransferase
VRRVADGVMGTLARLLVRIFFRRVEVEHGEAIVPGVPTVVVANHTNGLVDGLLLMSALRRYPRFLGKSTLFKILPLRPFLKLAGVVPVYRSNDGESTSKNAGAFAMCRRLLAQGGMVALFPEGISHDEPSLQPLKTGAARIALGAALDDGVEGVVTVAVGLAYDHKARFRSRALVRVGAAQPVSDWAQPYRRDDHEATRALTDDMAARLRAVSPDYESWIEAETLARLAEVVDRPLGIVPAEVDLARRERLARALAEGTGPDDALSAAFERYERDLDLLGLSDAQVGASYRAGHLRLLLVAAIVKVVVAAPFAAVGAVVHVVPYQIMKKLGALPANEGMKATVKLLGCFALFTLLYIALGVVFGIELGWGAGILAALAAPACGYVAVLFSERVKRVGGAIAGARAVRTRRAVIDSVLADRRAVVELAQVELAQVDPAQIDPAQIDPVRGGGETPVP